MSHIPPWLSISRRCDGLNVLGFGSTTLIGRQEKSPGVLSATCKDLSTSVSRGLDAWDSGAEERRERRVAYQPEFASRLLTRDDFETTVVVLRADQPRP